MTLTSLMCFLVCPLSFLGPPQILICGESGGASRPYQLAERFGLCDLAADATELLPRVELGTSSLPRMRSTTELKQHFLLLRRGRSLLSERRDSNPRPPAWKASALSTELLSQGFALLTPMWVRMDSNHRSRRQQIYSLPHLATLEHTRLSMFICYWLLVIVDFILPITNYQSPIEFSEFVSL